MSRSNRPRLRWRVRAAHADTSTALIRYVGDEIYWRSGEDIGFVQLAIRLRNSGTLPDREHRTLRDLICWFNRYLAQPRRFSPYKEGWKRSRFGCLRQPIAISWFKDSARAHLRRADALATFLNERGISVRRISTQRPGYITYEDRYQVVAVPFR